MKRNKELKARDDNTRYLLRPACEVKEENHQILVEMEMPGVDKSGVDISVENNLLTVTGRKAIEELDGKYLSRERRPGDYRRAFTIDETIDPDAIEATINNGVLRLSLGLRDTAKPKKIEVKAG